jgi:tetratricopeptide (TPR) repeat protein
VLQRNSIIVLGAVLLGLFLVVGGDNAHRQMAQPENLTCQARLLADAADGRLDRHSLVRAALIANGVEDPTTWQQTETAVMALGRELRASGHLRGSIAEQARAIHQFLHQRVLTGGYDPRANNLADVFRNGRFNCITSSTLLMALAGECGLESAAIEMPAHVLVVLDPRRDALAVETTCPAWRSIELAGFQGCTSQRAVAVRGYQNASGRVIGAAELLGTYYHNRGVARLAAGEFAEAVAANRNALELDRGCGAARQNLLAAWNNWALALAAAGNYSAALEKIDAGLAMSPGYEPLLKNRAYIQSCQRSGDSQFHSARFHRRAGETAPG